MKILIPFLSLLLCFGCQCEDDLESGEEVLNNELASAKGLVLEQWRIEDRKVGPFAIGDAMPVQGDLNKMELERMERTKNAEGEAFKIIEYSLQKDGKELMRLWPQMQGDGSEKLVIHEIRIYSNEIRSAENIGVGSSIEEFVEAYSQARIWYTYVGDMFVLQNADSPVQYLLQADDYKGTLEFDSEITPLKLEDFHTGAQIREVRIF